MIIQSVHILGNDKNDSYLTQTVTLSESAGPSYCSLLGRGLCLGEACTESRIPSSLDERLFLSGVAGVGEAAADIAIVPRRGFSWSRKLSWIRCSSSSFSCAVLVVWPDNFKKDKLTISRVDRYYWLTDNLRDARLHVRRIRFT
jgi:hypothetical protein